MVNNILSRIDELLWGFPLMLLMIAGGVYFTWRLNFIQIRKLPLAFKLMLTPEPEDEEHEGHGGRKSGQVSSFEALCTSLGASIGTGNIVGVAMAVAAGGPGAIFWMVLAAFLGMAIMYTECYLAVKYRTKDADGNCMGGPFAYIENGLGSHFKPLAKAFALSGMCSGLLGIGTFAQVNGMMGAVKAFFETEKSSFIEIPKLGCYSHAVIIASVVLTLCVAMVLIGGIKRIAGVASVLVPFMAAFYLVFCLIIIIGRINEVPRALAFIIESAFNPKSALGGSAGSVFLVIRMGLSKGIFSNEAGLGSAPIAAASAKTDNPEKQGLISMLEPFIDTVIMCTISGLVLVLTDAWKLQGMEGAAVTTLAFAAGLNIPERAAAFIILICLCFFAFTSILGWSHYSEKCCAYLSNQNSQALKIFRLLYIAAVFIGAYTSVELAWTIANIFNACMAIINMPVLFGLIKRVRE